MTAEQLPKGSTNGGKRTRTAGQTRQKPAAAAGAVVKQFPAGPPHRVVNVTSERRPYRYSVGTDGHARGVYQGEPQGDDAPLSWIFRAPLPHVHARVVRRDGSQRRIGTDYLISAGADDARVIVTDQDFADGTWAIKVGANLSSDKGIITAAGTALRDVAYRDAPESEATPRPDVHSASGHVDLPIRECLPDGYLTLPPLVTADDARQVMREVVTIAAANPKMALTLGASAASPFVGPLRRQSHWWDLYGDSRRGKSTTIAVAAAVWGDPRIGTGITLPWNASSIGSGRHLGQLGILAAYFDERGLVGRDKSEWGELIYATCQGSSRLTAEMKGSGTRRSAPWFGVLFSTGNARLTDGIAAGRFAGIPARVIELGTPLTRNKHEAKRLTDKLLPRCYGWLGGQILTDYTAARVGELLTAAERLVGTPDGGVPGTLAEHLHLAVAGAMMADAILGTGNTLTAAAATAAREYLGTHGHEPEHDADRMIDALAESLVARRPAWPTASEYAELGQASGWTPMGSNPSKLAQHGYDRELCGVRTDDGEWLYVLPSAWRAIADELGVDSSVACAEMHSRGLLHVPDSVRTQGEWQARRRIDGKPTRVYQVALSGLEGDQDDDDQTPPAPLSDITPPPPAAPTGPCEQCQQPGEWCGFGDVAEDYLPCVCCGRPHKTRSACGAPRQANCPGPNGSQTLSEPSVTPAPAPAPTEARRPAKARKAGKRDAALAAAKTALDAGEPVRLLAALETTHAPMRRGDDGRMHAAFWRPEMPGMLQNAHIVKGWAWSRPYAGPVTVLDKSGAWVAAAASVEVAHGKLERSGDADFTGLPGYYQITVYPWTEQDMPHPLGNPHIGAKWKPGDLVWVPAPTVALLRDLAAAGRWPDVAVTDSYTSPGARVNTWTTHVNELRAYAIRTYGRDSDQYDAVKNGYGQAMSLMIGHAKDDGIGWEWKCGAQRPDWTHAFRAQGAAMIWRRADQCRQVAPELGPVALRNVDELLIPTEALEIVTTVTPPGAQHPAIVIDPDGIALRSFKVKGTEEWEAQS